MKIAVTFSLAWSKHYSAVLCYTAAGRKFLSLPITMPLSPASWVPEGKLILHRMVPNLPNLSVSVTICQNILLVSWLASDFTVLTFSFKILCKIIWNFNQFDAPIANAPFIHGPNKLVKIVHYDLDVFKLHGLSAKRFLPTSGNCGRKLGLNHSLKPYQNWRQTLNPKTPAQSSLSTYDSTWYQSQEIRRRAG